MPPWSAVCGPRITDILFPSIINNTIDATIKFLSLQEHPYTALKPKASVACKILHVESLSLPNEIPTYLADIFAASLPSSGMESLYEH
jgi:hypothetical protein